MIQYDVFVFMQAYDPQTGYDLTPYFRPSAMDETLRGQGLPSPQEVNLNAYFDGKYFASHITTHLYEQNLLI